MYHTQENADRGRDPPDDPTGCTNNPPSADDENPTRSKYVPSGAGDRKNLANGGGAGPEPAPPQQIGKYRILKSVGSGGSGVVYRAFDVELRRVVALKVILGRHRNRSAWVKRFRQEARITARLGDHPGICKVYETGITKEGGETGRPYIAMQYVYGCTLAKWLKRKPATRLCVEYLEQVCRALGYSHSKKRIAHLDVKPSNIMVGLRYGGIYATDWGLAKRWRVCGANKSNGPLPGGDTKSDSSGRTPSTAASAPGTEAYMAPEQIAGQIEALDARTDVFAVGVILYEILTHSRLFGNGSREDALAKAYRWLDGYEGEHEPLCQLAMDCLSISRDDRPENALAVADRLKEHLENLDSQVKLDREARVEAEAQYKASHTTIWWTRVACGLACTLAIVVPTGIKYLYEQAAHRERLSRETERAITKALGDGREALLANQPQDALGLATTAEGLVDPWDADEPRKRAVREEVASIQRVAKRDVEMRRLVARLTTIRGSKEDRFGSGSADGEYQRAFAEAGLNVEASDEGAALLWFTDRPGIRDELVAALDDWASERRRRKESEEKWRRLFALADKVSADPHGKQLRQLASRSATPSELSELKTVVQSGEVIKLPEPSVLLLADALARANAGQEAEDALRIAREANPNSVWLNYYLGERLYARQKHLDALPFHTAAQAMRPELGHQRAHVLEALCRFPEAESAFRKMAELQPDNPHHINCLAGVLARMGRLDEALKCVDRAIAKNPHHPRFHFNRGTILWAQKKHSEAEDCFTTAVGFEDRFGMAWFNLGSVRKDLNKWPESETAFKRYIELSPEDAAGHVMLGFARANRGKWGESINSYRKARALRPGDAELCERLGRCYMKLGNLPDAEKQFREAIRLNPDMTDSYQLFGGVLARQGRYLEAVQFYEGAFRDRPALAERVETRLRYNAACYALRAATGSGNDASGLDVRERKLWRQKALNWLRADLEAWKARAKEKPELQSQLRDVLEHWQTDGDLSSAREGAKELPHAERESWERLWVDVSAMIRVTNKTN